MIDNDAAMREHAATTAMPEFDEPAFTKVGALSEARVAIVTSAALHVDGDTGWAPNADPQFKVIEDTARDLRLTHFSPNFDRSGFHSDINVVYPVDRLHELVDRGVIGSVSPRHYAFAGNQDDTVSAIRLDTGPNAAKFMLQNGADVVLLTPVRRRTARHPLVRPACRAKVSPAACPAPPKGGHPWAPRERIGSDLGIIP